MEEFIASDSKQARGVGRCKVGQRVVRAFGTYCFVEHLSIVPAMGRHGHPKETARYSAYPPTVHALLTDRMALRARLFWRRSVWEISHERD
eukprot:scaffold112471_cov31-Tisochrysis_lutea.AAC.3